MDSRQLEFRAMNAFLSEAVTEGEALHDLIDYYVADGRRAIEATGNMFRNRRYRRLAFA
jgi:hypothetical protein